MGDENNWLPDLLLLEDFGGDWEKYFNAVYRIFERDFERSKPIFAGHTVNLKRHPTYNDKSATFWHTISEGKDESERTPDIRRCERIAWLKPIFEEFQEVKPTENSKIRWWLEMRGKEERYHLALPDFSYVVVVAKRTNFVLPWTAFYVEYNHQRRKYQKKYEKYWDIIGNEKS
ncbi:hypothetical protein BKG94_07725 [Rodentibacter ratti]|uniref:hypothetical protein n=1 Tax=Rodentibacter ratti TaxID=1906745 RepID=UPI00098796FF|nr:hypothetical protein [Rodentibacter ratti]OOF88180.1 hypothetical protein BKG94_07725 [Rodentibacter ratti]